jgi:peroxiredoxin (alkyl hydroperoxide reductase subunit C)
MAEEMKAGCARPTGGPVGETVEPESKEEQQQEKKVKPMIHVGKKAPDFTAPVYHNANSSMSSCRSI